MPPSDKKLACAFARDSNLAQAGQTVPKARETRCSLSEGFHADPPSLVNQPLWNTGEVTYAWRTSNVASNANEMVGPRSPLLPILGSQTSGHGNIQMDRGLPWGGQQSGTALFPSASSSSAVSAAAALASAAAAVLGAEIFYSRQTANSATFALSTSAFSSSVCSPPRASQKRRPPSFRPARSLASSVMRLISSRTTCVASL